jgi:DNA-binding PadR family transcriptional regulator
LSADFFYLVEKFGRISMDIGVLEQQVMLAIMGLHPNAYGISIADHINSRAGYEPSVGSIYATLERLQEKGYVRSRQGEPTAARGGRRKLYFTITATGQEALRQSLQAISSLRRGVRWKEAIA